MHPIASLSANQQQHLMNGTTTGLPLLDAHGNLVGGFGPTADGGQGQQQLGMAAVEQDQKEDISSWERQVCANIEERVQLKRSLLDLKHSE